MKPALFASASIAALLSSLACAQPAPRPSIGGHGDNVAAFISQHDDDGDGRLTWEEFDAFRRHRFDATDANGDGVVSEAEYVAEFAQRSRTARETERDAQMRQAETRFTALDADKDGRIGRAEFKTSGERVYEHGLKVLAERLEKARAAKNDDEKSRILAPWPRNRAQLPNSHDAAGFLELYDDDGDGTVSRAEFDLARNTQFARTDANRDDALSRAEYLAEFRSRIHAHIASLVGSDPDRQSRIRFAALDTDKDGGMTFEEYQASGKRLFERGDRDGNGIVDGQDATLPPLPRPPREESPTP